MRRVALLLGLGGAVAGLALTATPSGAHVTHDELPVFIRTESSATSYQFAWIDEGRRPARLADTLAVFGKPSALDDILPAALQQRAHWMSQPGFEVDAPRARLLVASGTHRIWGVPMKNGSVCIFREVFVGGTNCVPGLRHGAYPEVDPGWRSRRGQVWGLADNGAVSIRVQLDSGWVAAKLGRNGFYLELAPSIVAPKQIEVRERSGLRHIYDIKRCRPDTGFPLVGPLGPPPC